VPVVPGTLEALNDLDEARRIALEIGFPIMLKAAAGGGGKGMRAVFSAADLEVALESARSEATRSFGDASVYLEKLVVRPRHVEIQVLADGFGRVVHLFERDCSIQRRHQKVVEEAPSPALDEATRQAMAAAACRAAAAVGYVGAGTCEFLLGADGAFYFLEMNTRLQVEHPITEAITGVDLVQAQLRVAAGEPLWFRQEDLQIRGHAVELRIYAEDAVAGFRPAPGPLFGYREPAGPWVRTDSGVVEGMEVPIHYDPMIAKLVVWGQDRDEALRRARRALEDYHIVGTTTSIPFFLDLFQDPDFVAGHYDTGFITPDRLARLKPPEEGWEDLAIAAAITAWRQEAARSGQPAAAAGAQPSAWRWAQPWKTLRRMP
jgi:acetyl-CoA carboxylase biotin carboxylase subunit